MWQKIRNSILTGLLFSSPLLAADKVEPVREIDLKGYKAKEIPQNNADKPAVIASPADLMAVLPETEFREPILKSVNFEKEKLLFFKWAGSGGDRLTVERKDNGPVVFRLAPGLTDDLRPHFHLFVMPKDATWKVIGR